MNVNDGGYGSEVCRERHTTPAQYDLRSAALSKLLRPCYPALPAKCQQGYIQTNS